MREFLDIAIPAITFYIMFAVGIELRPDDFRRIVLKPTAVAVGIVCQAIALPSIGIITVLALGLDVTTAGGVLLICACPAGGISNFYCLLARADVAMSIALTVFSCVVAVISIPLALIAYDIALGEGLAFPVPFDALMLQLAAMVLLPVAIGMIVRIRYAEFVRRYSKSISVGATAFLGLLIAFVFIKDPYTVVNSFGASLFAVPMITISAIAVGYATSVLLSLNRPGRIAFSIEFGVRNIAIAASIAITMLNNVEFAAFATAYFLVQVPILIAVILFARQWQRL